MQNSGPSSDAVATTAPARGRPRAFDRTAALEQATRLFWAKGFEATSIADLTHAMGIGAPSLYAAFQSKEALYAEALRHYAVTNEGYVWAGFHAAGTARDAVRSFLEDSAAALTGCVADIPRGCMVTLSSVGSEGHADLGELARSARAVTFERLSTRLDRAVAEGEIPTSTDLHALARFVQTVQNGMSILARDGASRADLEAVADVAMAGWDVRTAGPGDGGG
ncbi:TetR/AcrR family transcriptional regulator [Labrys wisconsinensis]|uniref:TetR/AcrR family transcriptional regulator n=1 Tax=Labrys wisconsinensis TaxID=425677 RepID=UPI0027D8F4C2|nr:TetR/AcrR family transcriptional regulator [Labrys wisconsinensis]